MSATTTPSLISDTLTDGVRVRVEPRFLDDYSDPDEPRYVFAYQVRLTNEGTEAIQLLSRHWIIIDAEGQQEEVRGEGVVGEQPTLYPGELFEYSSFCDLTTPWGTMEGWYRMRRDDGNPVDIRIGRFFLVS